MVVWVFLVIVPNLLTFYAEFLRCFKAAASREVIAYDYELCREKESCIGAFADRFCDGATALFHPRGECKVVSTTDAIL